MHMPREKQGTACANRSTQSFLGQGQLGRRLPCTACVSPHLPTPQRARGRGFHPAPPLHVVRYSSWFNKSSFDRGGTTHCGMTHTARCSSVTV
jgi:hypothetical protein